MTDEVLPWKLKSADLGSFVSTHLRQKESFLDELKRALDRVVAYLKKRASYSVSRVEVCGDLTSGCSALNDEEEFQLCLFVSDFRSIDDYHKGIAGVIAQSRDLLDAEEVIDTVMLRKAGNVAHSVTHEATQGVIHVRLMVGDEWLDGSVVPGVDLIGPKPSKSNKETMYRQFMQDEKKSPYLPTLSCLQHRLFQSLPTAVKDAILLVKYWRKHRLVLRTDKPTARFYELLMINCWERAGNPEVFDLAVALKSVFMALGDWKSIHVTWEKSQSLVYPRRIAEGKIRDILSRSGDYDGPIALDPVDPRLEYCAGVKTLIWDEISRMARDTLLEPLFRGCSQWKFET